MPQALPAEAFTALRLQYKTPPAAPGEYPADFEHFSPHGMMVDFYIVTPAPETLALPEVQAMEQGLAFVRFIEQRDGAPWLVNFRPNGGTLEDVQFCMTRAEMDRMLQNCGVILPHD